MCLSVFVVKKLFVWVKKMTDLFTAKRSYVREFNAASLSDALILADQALRMDGVTVAVWKNRVESLALNEQIARQTKIDTLVRDAFSSRIKHAKHMLGNLGYIVLYGDVRDESNEVLTYFYESPYSNSQSLPVGLNIKRINLFSAVELSLLQDKFEKAKSFIRLERHYNNLIIHKDKGYPKCKIQSDLLFQGVDVRMIEILCGDGTIFYKNNCGHDSYHLAFGAAAFCHPAYMGEKSAFHGAAHDKGEKRAVVLTDFLVRGAIPTGAFY